MIIIWHNWFKHHGVDQNNTLREIVGATTYTVFA